MKYQPFIYRLKTLRTMKIKNFPRGIWVEIKGQEFNTLKSVSTVNTITVPGAGVSKAQASRTL